MLLVYDHDNVLHITNERGLRWNYDKADKPSFGFDYDFIFYVPFDDSFEYELNRKVEKLSEENIAEIEEYIKLCEPPLELTMAKQYSDDIQESVKNRRTIGFERLGFFKFDNMTEILIASREGSNDPRRQIARRFLDWNDFLVGTAYRICEELNATLDEDLQDFDTYLQQLPEPPPQDEFTETHWADDRFETKSDTFDVNGGQDSLGEDKRAV
jgi:hypothetical protein|tara:strand:- start:1825 stop:2463 length:639 start_codon:yes stop_codon:yes gene_type:complete